MDLLSCEGLDHGRVPPLQRGPPGRILGSRVVELPLKRHVHVVSPQRLHKAGNMVPVWVGEYHHVQAMVPEGEPFTQKSQEPVWVRPAVDENLPASRGNDESGVSLPHVQKGDVEPAVGPGEGGSPHARRCQEDQRQRQPEDAASQQPRTQPGQSA